MRKKYTLYNLVSSLGGQIISLLIGVISRAYFLKYLGVELSGLNSLCITIISSLSIAELGIGDAITFNLYKPLAEGNKDKIIALMGYFKKMYIIIAFIILAIGIIFIPFLPLFTAKLDKMIVLIVFLMFLFNSFISYFFSYKRVLLFSNQKDYLISFIHYMFYIIQNIIQIVILIYTSNIYLFLLVMIVATFGENFILSYIADKKYSFLHSINKTLDKNSRRELFKDMKSTLLFKIGRLITENEDNLIISFFIGVSNVGFYANYLLIMTSLRSILLKVFKSCLASLGNLNAENNDDYKLTITNVLVFINIIISGLVMMEFTLLINRFITLWVGEKYLFSESIVILLGFIMFLQCSRAIFTIFRDGFGLFRIFNWRSLAEAVMNFILSATFVQNYGIFGIFLGTAISNFLFFLVEPILVYRYKFHQSILNYLILFIKVLSISSLCTFTFSIIIECLPNTWIVLFCAGLISTFIYIIFIICIFRKNISYQFFLNITYDVINKKFNKKIR